MHVKFKIRGRSPHALDSFARLEKTKNLLCTLLGKRNNPLRRPNINFHEIPHLAPTVHVYIQSLFLIHERLHSISSHSHSHRQRATEFSRHIKARRCILPSFSSRITLYLRNYITAAAAAAAAIYTRFSPPKR